MERKATTLFRRRGLPISWQSPSTVSRRNSATSPVFGCFALGGNDSVQVDTPFGAEIYGGDGNDTIIARNGYPHIIDGGEGYDTVTIDSADTELNCECVNPYTAAVDNRAMQVNVLVMNFAPHVPSQGNQLLWQAFGWTDPRVLAADYEATIERTSGGLVNMQIVDWMDLDTLVPRADGYVYGADEYYDIWSTTRTIPSTRLRGQREADERLRRAAACGRRGNRRGVGIRAAGRGRRLGSIHARAPELLHQRRRVFGCAIG